MHETALFQIIFKFCTYLPKFSNILLFFVLSCPFSEKKKRKKRMPLLSRIGTGRILKGTFFEIWVFRLLENAFPAHFLTSDHTLFIADKLHPPPSPHEYYGLVIKYTKSCHPNRCIKVGNKLPRLPCW